MKAQTFVIDVGSFFHLIYPNPITYSLRSFCLRQEQGKKLIFDKVITFQIDFTIKELFYSKFESILKLGNCISILKIYPKLFLACSFIEIFAFEVSALLKNNFIRTQIFRFSIL